MGHAVGPSCGTSFGGTKYLISPGAKRGKPPSIVIRQGREKKTVILVWNIGRDRKSEFLMSVQERSSELRGNNSVSIKDLTSLPSNRAVPSYLAMSK